MFHTLDVNRLQRYKNKFKYTTNYIKKLVKEFKTLPYEYGAAIGFSMIVDDLKLLDDAINEASIQMRENKETIETNEKES